MIDPIFIYEYSIEKDKMTLPALAALVKSIKHKKLTICVMRVIQEDRKLWCRVVLGHPEYIYNSDGSILGTYKSSEQVNSDGLKIKYHSSITCARKDCDLLQMALNDDYDRRGLPIEVSD